MNEEGASITTRVVVTAKAELEDSVRAALARARLQPADDGPTLLFFDILDESLLALPGLRGSVCVASGAELRRAAMLPLLRAGAVDVLDRGQPDWALRAKALFEHQLEVARLLDSEVVRENAIGQSRRFRAALAEAVRLSQTEASVLLTGETGTGKDLLAQVIHALYPRPGKGRLIVLDCTTLTSELSGSELFGHERGAFTGALTAREGVIAQAENGTLFLDEIGELPLSLQAQLLRVIQERHYRRVGADSWRNSSFRLVCATHRNLEDDVRTGRFRADLFYRIAASCVHVAPLRERRSDVLPLARHFLKHLSDGRRQELDPMVEEHLTLRDYPGNVRELKQLIARAYHRAVGPGPLAYAALPEEEWSQPALDLERELEPVIRKALGARRGLKEIGRASRELAVQIALEDAAGNLQRAASALGVTDRALQIRRSQRPD